MFLAAGLAACSPTPERAPRIVLVVVDGMRADQLPSAAELPWLEGATRFSLLRAPAPWSAPSARALLGAEDVEDFDPADTLPLRLSASGWDTSRAVSDPGWTAQYGLGEGWTRGDGEVTSTKGFVDMLAGSGPVFGVLQTSRAALWADGPVAAGDRVQHDAAVAASLAELQAVVDALDFERDTLFLTSGHGTELGEHGLFGSGHHLWEEQLRVPLAVRGPGWPDQELGQAVELADVGATIAALAGVGSDMGGRDLRGLFDAEIPWVEQAVRLGSTRYGPARAGVIAGSEKWIGWGGGMVSVDLAADPAEQAPELTQDWTGAGRAAWQERVGADTRRVWYVSLGQLSDTRAPLADGEFSGMSVRHPVGLTDLWSPLGIAHPSAWALDATDDNAVVRRRSGKAFPAEFSVQPRLSSRPEGLELIVTVDGLEHVGRWEDGATELVVGPDGHQARLRPAWVPAPEIQLGYSGPSKTTFVRGTPPEDAETE